MTLLRVSGLSIHRGKHAILRDVAFTVGPGELIGLIGANGAGKTTLLRAVLGLLPATGHSSLAALPQRDRAKRAAWMPQTREVAWPVSVERLITLGRLPHLGAGQAMRPADRAAIDSAIADMGLEAFRHRTATDLSGGELARVLIARTLAQDTPLVMADEPIAGLDPAHQIQTMRLFAGLAGAGRSAMVSIHDLGLAARHCTRLILLGGGRLVADGAPGDVLTPDNLTDHFNITAHFAQTEAGPIFQPLDVVGTA
ncbi:ABC transporter ATP-binding protein [Salibaculum halophilum]|uniref:ABC transporter ATP-binding protein n=1 Tax=Salibaculum halophilum TaxID=1914408 RepID=UPI000A10C5E2|nr:ABC transporter ATP-binding protein [Salibaculum halophilum]